VTQSDVTVAIPTYRREGVLLDILGHLLDLEVPPAEILVIDQTERHEPATEARLGELHDGRCIRWIRVSPPSIPRAMNRGLLEARRDIVLFLDDDIRPEPELVAAHEAAHEVHGDILVAGRVIQPWEEDTGARAVTRSTFAELQPGWVREFMGGNFSVRRDTALRLGGFDENFVRVAYHFEAEFTIGSWGVAVGSISSPQPAFTISRLAEAEREATAITSLPGGRTTP
jgi:glycosyltransferase involved in cell wall biosynthesis